MGLIYFFFVNLCMFNVFRMEIWMEVVLVRVCLMYSCIEFYGYLGNLLDNGKIFIF